MTAHCPYNPSHIVPMDSLLRHLNRCTATNKNQFEQCKFNQLHVIRKEAITNHYKQCPDNKNKYQNNDDDWEVPEKTSIIGFDYDQGDFYQEKRIRGEGRPKKNAAPPQHIKKKAEKSWDSESEQQQKPGKYDKKWQQPSSNIKKEKEIKKLPQNLGKVPFDCDQSFISKQKKSLNKGAKLQDF